MDLRGDAKIQALFSDLMLEDQSVAPVFEKLCRGAKAEEPERQQASGRSLVLVTTMAVITTLCSLAWWYWNTPNRPDRKTLSEFSATTSIPVVPLIETPSTRTLDGPAKTIQATHAIHKAVGRWQTRTARGDAVLQKAAVISSWQSPTAILMDAPAGSVLNESSPQLNQSVRELEEFLPATR